MSIQIVYGYSGDELLAEDGRGAEWHRYAGIDQFGDIVGAAGRKLGGFGEIHMSHGYGYDGFGDGTLGVGRMAGDDLSQAPFNVPLNVSATDPAAMLAAAMGIDYSVAVNVDPGIASNINNWIQTAAVFSTQLATAFAAASSAQQAALQAAYDNTQANLSNFQAIGQQLTTDTGNASKIQSWISVGQSIITNANTLANALPQSSISVAQLFSGFPQSLADVMAWSGKQIVAAVKYLVDQSGQIAKQASWSIAEILLLVGGAAVLVLWGAKAAGVKVNLPFVSLNGYTKRARRTSRRGRNRR